MGSLVFLYLGIKGLKIAFQKKMIEAAKTKKKAHPLIIGIAMTLPNPFTIIFWATALTSLTIGYKPVILLAIVLIAGGSWAAIEAGIIHFSRKLISEKLLRGMEAVTSLVIIGFAIKFIIQVIEILTT